MSEPTVRQPRPALVIRRIFAPDLDRAATALARLLATRPPAQQPEHGEGGVRG